MAYKVSCFQPTVIRYNKGRKSKRKTKGAVWWIGWRDKHGALHRKSTGTRCKRVAQQYAAKLEMQFAQGNLNLVDPFAEGRKQPISEHVQDYEQYLKDQGRTASYIKTTLQRVNCVIDTAEIDTVADISASKVEAALATICRKRGLSTAGRNHYLRAIKMLVSFLVLDRRISTDDDPLARLRFRGTDSDRRRERRALTEEEFRKLVTATAKGPIRSGLDGTARALMYILAHYTGYRRAAIASLTPSHFQLDSNPAWVRLAAKDAKNRKKALPAPLLPEIAKMLKGYFVARDLEPNDIIWPIKRKRTGELVRADLEAAKVPYRDEQGFVVDFHALRGSFATSLDRAGVQLAEAQKLLGHSDPKLTSNCYTFSTLGDLARAVAKLPPPPVIEIA